MNWFIPALVNRGAREWCGIRLDEGTTSWPRAAKKRVKADRSSLASIPGSLPARPVAPLPTTGPNRALVDALPERGLGPVPLVATLLDRPTHPGPQLAHRVAGPGRDVLGREAVGGVLEAPAHPLLGPQGPPDPDDHPGGHPQGPADHDRRPEPLVELVGGRPSVPALGPGDPSRSRRSPLAVPARRASTLTTGLAKARWASREAESTVAVTDSVLSSTASTRAISPLAWSTAWRASATRGTASARSASTPRSKRRTWPTRTTAATRVTTAAMQATTAATRTTTSAADMPKLYVSAMPTMGAARGMAPVDPKKLASPKLKRPPSEATSQ